MQICFANAKSGVGSNAGAVLSKYDLLLTIAMVVNSWYTVIMPMPRKSRSNCLLCGEKTARAGYKYCSNRCQLEYQRKVYIAGWKAGKIKGLQSLGIVSSSIKRYLRDKFDNKCCLCGWSEVNQKTGEVPLVADHIDGNWRNNVEKNLRLICPNCDSLTPTYAGLNRGNGRGNRVLSKRAQEGRLLKKIKPV